jgi:hypothetical protein
MCRKSFTIATFIRHLQLKKPLCFHVEQKDFIKSQLTIWKGFSAYMPDIKYIFRVDRFLLLQNNYFKNFIKENTLFISALPLQ